MPKSDSRELVESSAVLVKHSDGLDKKIANCGNYELYTVEKLVELVELSRHPNKVAYCYDVMVKWEGFERPSYMPLDKVIEDVPDLAWPLIMKELNVTQDRFTKHVYLGDSYY